ncbi:hypothetical protein [Streptomyces sp. MMBL 11-3]|uniref:hypothetical protein n=1 Tax=Streptomyces sp. MMBL 11-3 TaxID=3382639 RepID=UPI0039B56978
MHVHHRAAAVLTALLLPLAAACGDSDQGTAERAGDVKVDSKTKDAKPVETEEAPAEPVEEETPDTELAVGDTFRYTDGVEVTVDSINTITEFGTYDERPDAKDTAFRITWTVENGTGKPLDLDAWSFNPQGATTGGQTTFVYVEKGSKEMAGRLAPSRKGTYTGEYSLPRADGKEVVVEVSRMDDAWMENDNAFGDEPNWTGAIK